MSSYDYLTGVASDPRDNVGKVRKMGHHKGFGSNNPDLASNKRAGMGIGDLINQTYVPVELPLNNGGGRQT